MFYFNLVYHRQSQKANKKPRIIITIRDCKNDQINIKDSRKTLIEQLR